MAPRDHATILPDTPIPLPRIPPQTPPPSPPHFSNDLRAAAIFRTAHLKDYGRNTFLPSLPLLKPISPSVNHWCRLCVVLTMRIPYPNHTSWRNNRQANFISGAGKAHLGIAIWTGAYGALPEHVCGTTANQRRRTRALAKRCCRSLEPAQVLTVRQQAKGRRTVVGKWSFNVRRNGCHALRWAGNSQMCLPLRGCVGRLTYNI
jgi:hypothetical protein